MKWHEGFWYFAHPYSAKKPDGSYCLEAEEANFRLCCIRSARLILAGWRIYSPITATHPIHCASAEFLAGQIHELWYEFDNAAIDQLGFSGIILAPGWEKSTGCRQEKERFEAAGKPVLYLCENQEVMDYTA